MFKLEFFRSEDIIGLSLVTKNHVRNYFIERERVNTLARISFCKEKFVRYTK